MALLSWLMAYSAMAAGPRGLWSFEPAGGGALKSARPGVHAIQFDPQVLAQWPQGEEGELALPSGKSYTIKADRIEAHSNGDLSWIGKFDAGGQPWVTVLTYGSAGVVGEVRAPEGMMVVRMEGSQAVLVDVTVAGWVVPPATEDDFRFPAIPDGPREQEAPNGLKATPTPQTTIDVLIAYTDGMVTREGSVAAVLTRLNQLIATANQAYVDSEVAITLRLVHAAQVAYTDAGPNSSALNDLDADAGALAGVRTTLRDRYGADLVTLVRPTRPFQGNCGIATVGGAYGDGDNIHLYSNFIFSVVSDGTVTEGNRTYICTNDVFPHELGHMMGALHDIQTITQGGTLSAGYLGAYSYSYGYTANATFDPGTGQNGCNAGAGTSCFGTIMSYLLPTRILKFSSPNLSNCGNAQACGTATADVAQTLNRTRNGPSGTRGVASWRATKMPFTGVQTGTPQATPMLTPFPAPLQVTIRDAANQLVPGVVVNFVAPGVDASATFPLGSTATSDANGVAQVNATANAIAGTYNVVGTANPSGVATSFNFSLTNGSVTPTITVTKKGMGTGTVNGSFGVIACGATCSATVVNGTPVTLTGAANGGSVFTGWLGSGCTGTAPCTLTVNSAKTVDATFALGAGLVPPGAFPSKIDVDLNNSYTALTDGLVIMRHLFGITGEQLINGAIGDNPGRNTAGPIGIFLTDILPELDIDGDGRADALTDGLLILRYLFGLRGTSLIAGAIGTGATRTTAADIETYLQSLMP